MIRTAANRAGSVFWSAAEWGTGLLPWQAPTAEASPGRASMRRATAAQPTAVARPGPDAPPLPPTPTACTSDARKVYAAQLLSHPVDVDTDDTSDADQDDLISPRGVWVEPQTPPKPPDAGLRLAFVLEREIAAPMDVIARLICNSDQGSAWIDRCVESRLLIPTTTGPIAYHRYTLPWVGDRDSVTRATLERVNLGTVEITVQPWDRPDIELPPGTIRLPWVEGRFTLTALGPDATHVCHTSHLMLGGRIPRVLAPMIRRKVPKTLERLAALVETDTGVET